MKFLFKLFVLVVIATIVAIYASDVSGRVLIFIGNFRIDLSMLSLLVDIAILYVVVHYLLKLIFGIWYLPRSMYRWKNRRNISHSRQDFNQAMIGYFANKYDYTYKYAINSLTKKISKDEQFLALMLAYKSANHMRDYVKEEDVLSRLDQYTDKKWQLAKLMLMAQNQYMLQKYGLCLDNLKMALSLDKKNFSAKLLMLKVYVKLGSFLKAYEELNWLIGHGYLENVETYKFEVYSGLFNEVTELKSLTQIYNKLDNKDKANNLINKLYLNELIRLKEYKIATDLIKSCTDLSGLGEVILILAKKLDNPNYAIELIEKCKKHLVNNKQDPELLLSLGILCFTLKQWNDARGYIESSILLKSTLDGYVYLLCIEMSSNKAESVAYASRNLLDNIYNLI